MNRFLDGHHKDTGNPEDYCSSDPVDALAERFDRLEINQTQIVKAINAIRKNQYRCSYCGRTGHNYKSCPEKKRAEKNKLKRKPERINTTFADPPHRYGDPNSDSENESDYDSIEPEVSDSDSSTEMNVNITRVKKKRN
jgi:hypothetical protein